MATVLDARLHSMEGRLLLLLLLLLLLPLNQRRAGAVLST
jgi:hypothetical protein